MLFLMVKRFCPVTISQFPHIIFSSILPRTSATDIEACLFWTIMADRRRRLFRESYATALCLVLSDLLKSELSVSIAGNSLRCTLFVFNDLLLRSRGSVKWDGKCSAAALLNTRALTRLVPDLDKILQTRVPLNHYKGPDLPVCQRIPKPCNLLKWF